ncbi:MAG TPA: CDP-alcohol phosphatidyltransferase family protein, partial [Candidatus Binataceae bacterium]
VSDIVDGRVARRFAIASGSGRWLDATADVTFILVALFFKAEEGAIPVYIPVLIAASFSQFAFDSLILARASSGPIKSRLGHWGGIINYGLVIVLAAASRSIQTAVRIAAPLLAAFYLAAIAERAWLFYRAR